MQNHGSVLYEISIPVPKHFVKKNSRDIGRNLRTGRLFPLKSPELIQAERYLILEMSKALRSQNQLSISVPIIQSIHMEVIFQFVHSEFYCQTKGKKGEPIGRKNQKIPDLSNLLEIVQDSLQDANVIQNDNQIESIYAKKIPGSETRLVVMLYDMV